MPRTILVAGATGYIGRALVQALIDRGDHVRGLSRDPRRAADRQPAADWFAWDATEDPVDPGWLDGVSAVVNLSGENIGEGKWTPARKAELVASRVDATRKLASAADAAGVPVLVNASAIGWYGDDPAPVDESAPAATGWMGRLVEAWEGAAMAVDGPDVRVVTLRIGMVIGPGDKPFDKMVPPRPLPLMAGGPPSFPFPWVHLDDVVGVCLAAVDGAEWRGPINVVGREPTTLDGFFRELGSALGRTYLPIGLPVGLLRLFGEMPREMIQRRDVRPARVEALGYRWRRPALAEAVRASI